MLDGEKTDEYCRGFYGYGNWNSPIWFVGIEENGGYSKKEVEDRINSWQRFETPLIDNKEHHLSLKNEGITKLFTEGKRQPTWWKLIRLKLNYEGESVTNEKIRDIQKNTWGQTNSNSLLIELFPLPSPSIKDWKYNGWSDLDQLASRDKYFAYYSECRTNFIQNKIATHKPDLVIFYANKMIKYWNKIIEGDFNSIAKKKKIRNNYFRYLIKDSVCFVQSPQPAGVWSNEFWDNLGKELKRIEK